MRSIIMTAAHAAACLGMVCASAAEPTFDLSPVVVDGKDKTGATAGIEYKLKWESTLKSFDSPGSGAAISPDATTGSLRAGILATGLVTSSAERNPRNFLEFQGDAKLVYSSKAGSLIGAGFVKYETDQSFDNKQAVFGLGATYGKLGVFGRNDFFAFDAKYGRVDPKDDAERKVALGGGELAGYYRWDFEALYMLPLGAGAFRSLELNYRYFLERGAPEAVAAAGMDKHYLGTVRLGIRDDFFVAYTSGKLPFDRKSDNSLALGVSFKLK
jgi:hypothetical protein